jgi:ribonuclease D
MVSLPIRLPEPPPPSLVTDAGHLAELCARWSDFAAIGLDTEFVRTRTFFPRLGLIQIADPLGCYLVDTVALTPPDADAAEVWRPLVEVLVSRNVIKVLHSPSEDLEVFLHVFGSFPGPLFDTQIAATLAGLGSSPGYPRLMKTLFDVDLPKVEQRSDWLRRPLSEAQVRYASLDVAYLLPAHEQLAGRLAAIGRSEWAEEEFAALPELCRTRLDPEQVFERLHRRSMNEAQTAALHVLNAWREAEARRRDLPRGFVVQDAALVELARRLPRQTSDLRDIPGVGPAVRRQYGDDLVELVARARHRDAAASYRDSEITGDRSGAKPSRATVDRLRVVVASAAEDLGLPAEFLASRKLLEALVLEHRRNRELPAGLEGWRRQAVGERLLAELSDR